MSGLPAGAEAPAVRFTPQDFPGLDSAPLERPLFLPIVASSVLAKTLQRKSNGRVDGFVVEGPTAGGHNAPPRGGLKLSESGEPIYGERDLVDLGAMRELGVPFWLAGGYGSPERLTDAINSGAAGIQVGTAFALCAESGLRADYRRTLLQHVASGSARVFTDPSASPTGFPFKVAALEGSLSDPVVYDRRPRICDLGYLRELFWSSEGIDFRCASEPVSIYLSKGGVPADTEGRKCICNALIANVGHPQVRAGKYVEPGLVTAGDDLQNVARFISSGQSEYTAADVVRTLLMGLPTAPADLS